MQDKLVRFVIGSTGIGGAEKQVAAVLPKLAERGWKARLVTLSPDDDELAAAFFKNEINVIKPKSFRFTSGLFGIMCKFISILSHLYSEFKNRPGIVTVFMMSHSILFGMTAYFLAHSKGKRIFSIRNTIDRQHSYFLRAYETFLYKFADCFVVNSHELAEQLIGTDKIPSSKVRIVNNAFECNQFSHQINQLSVRKKLKIENKTKALLILARLVAFKGHDDLLYALSIAEQKLSKLTSDNWVCLFAGDGPEKARLEQKTKQLGLGRYVRFLGTCNNVNELLAICDLFVAPSHSEGMPNTVIEAMYMGKEVVGTDIMCMRELTQGLYRLVPIKSPNKLAEAIVEAIKNPNPAVGVKAKALIEKNFSIDKAVSGWERVIQNL
ncbi:MAG: glycosyltransferase [Holosporales bacterium]|jgi:glycosyltransferase involved in cell wall biosynthesis|nr:glycosyltransferase [Holosporales bacterium]